MKKLIYSLVLSLVFIISCNISNVKDNPGTLINGNASIDAGATNFIKELKIDFNNITWDSKPALEH